MWSAFDTLAVKGHEQDLTSGVAETEERKRGRLVREGRQDGMSVSSLELACCVLCLAVLVTACKVRPTLDVPFNKCPSFP